MSEDIHTNDTTETAVEKGQNMTTEQTTPIKIGGINISTDEVYLTGTSTMDLTKALREYATLITTLGGDLFVGIDEIVKRIGAVADINMLEEDVKKLVQENEELKNKHNALTDEVAELKAAMDECYNALENVSNFKEKLDDIASK